MQRHILYYTQRTGDCGERASKFKEGAVIRSGICSSRPRPGPIKFELLSVHGGHLTQRREHTNRRGGHWHGRPNAANGEGRRRVMTLGLMFGS
jgi:hypothetical protein